MHINDSLVTEYAVAVHISDVDCICAYLFGYFSCDCLHHRLQSRNIEAYELVARVRR